MKLLRFRDWPLRVKILVVLSISSTLPLVLAGLMGLRLARTATIDHAKRLLTAKANMVAMRLDDFHKRNQDEAKRLAHWDTFEKYARAHPTERRQLEQKIQFAMKTNEKNYAHVYGAAPLGIGLLGPSGNIVTATDRVPSQTFDLERHVNRYLKEALLGTATISVLYFASELDWKPTIAYAEPVKKENGEVVGVVVLWASAQAFWDILHQCQEELEPGYVSLFDPSGVRIGHSSKDEMRFHPAGDLSKVDPEALDAMIAEKRFGPDYTERLQKTKFFEEQFKRVRSKKLDTTPFEGLAQANNNFNVGVAQRLKCGWTFFYMYPEDSFAALGGMNIDQLSGLSGWAVYLIVVIALLSPLAGIFIAGVILKPVRDLARAFQKLGSADFDSRVKVHSSDELGSLGAGFNAMADRLAAAVKKLNEALAAKAASEARVSTIVELVADGIITLNDDGGIQSFNAAARRIFGYEPAEVKGRHAAVLLAVPEGQRPGEYLRQVLQGDQVNLQAGAELVAAGREVRGRRQDGRVFPMELAAAKVRVENGYLVAVTVRDLTAQKRAEEELRDARDAAQTSNRAKSQFLANMSHELRTPLTAIIGYSEMLREQALEEGHDALVPDLEQIHAQSKHLVSLINDLLDMSKIEAGKLQIYLETFDLADMVRYVAQTIQPLVAKNSNTLEMHAGDALGTMHSDVTRVRQCLFNLFSNACKFTENGTISLSLKAETVAGVDWVSFQIKDTGIGMTPPQVTRIFQPFTQGDLSTTRKYGGTGLGLSITRKLCQMMGGDLVVESVKDQGSTFTIRIPRDARQAQIEAPEKQPAPVAEAAAILKTLKPGQDTVLVIDDEQPVRDMLTRVLTKEGFQVVTCGSGEEGLRLAREIRPRVITLDVMMPGMDGWALLSILKADPDLADIPVIMITIVDDKNLGYAMGVSDYLTKPLDRERLLDVLRKRCHPTSRLALIAEDEPATRELLRRALEKNGWEVAEAANGRQALDCVQKRQPALIVLDLMMPEMDGFEFITELRQHPEWRSIPVVVLTAQDLTEEDRLFLNSSLFLSGCVKRVFQKGSFSVAELLQEVRELAAKAH